MRSRLLAGVASVVSSGMSRRRTPRCTKPVGATRAHLFTGFSVNYIQHFHPVVILIDTSVSFRALADKFRKIILNHVTPRSARISFMIPSQQLTPAVGKYPWQAQSTVQSLCTFGCIDATSRLPKRRMLALISPNSKFIVP